MHEVLVNRLGGLSLPRKSVVRLTDRPDMTLDVYRGRKTTMQQQQIIRGRYAKSILTIVPGLYFLKSFILFFLLFVLHSSALYNEISGMLLSLEL